MPPLKSMKKGLERRLSGLRVTTAFVEDLNLAPSTNVIWLTAACNSSTRGSDQHPLTFKSTYMLVVFLNLCSLTQIHINKSNKSFFKKILSTRK